MEPFQNTGQPDWEWWGRLWPTPEATLRTIGLERGDVVAEACCGNGYFALPAARIVDPATVYAIDVDEDLLAELEDLTSLQALENVAGVHADARELATALPEPVDVVLNANTFHGVDDATGFVDDARAALADDGRFVVVNWHDQPRSQTTINGVARGPPTELRCSPADTEAVVADAGGFDVRERVELPPYHYAVVFEKR
jgi:SAM-dependent methyltransferase